MKTSTTHGGRQQFYKSLFVGVCTLAMGLLLPALLPAAQEGVTARYVQAQGTQIVIEINTGSTPPASAILVQNLPPGVRILAAQPQPQHFSENRSKAKWLFRNLQADKSRVSMTLDRAVTANEISAELRFKSEQDGKMTTLQVEK